MTGSDRSDPALIRGWCPGVRRPMVSGDGFLVRLRLTAGVLAAETADEIAALSRRWGNGLLDLSQRGNLQLRGVAGEALDDLIGALDRLGLVDPSAEAEAVRNVVTSPLAGLDPAAPIDGGAVAAALEAGLAADTGVYALPGKFGFVVDDGGRLSLDDVALDVRLTGLATPEGPRVAVSVPTAPGHPQTIAVVAVEAAADRALDLARAVVRLRADRPDAPRRMVGIVQRFGLAALIEAAGFGEVMADVAPLPRRHGGRAVLGDHTDAPAAWIGVGAPFGRLTCDQLALLGEIAAERAAGELRLTPWRAVLIPGVAPAKVGRIRPWLRGARLIFAPDDPRLAVVACAGSTGCRNATRDTRADAEELAPLARRLGAQDPMLHVSGCGKGCAHPGAAAVTITARDGAYDLVRAGRAGDAPWLSGLDLDETASALADLASS